MRVEQGSTPPVRKRHTVRNLVSTAGALVLAGAFGWRLTHDGSSSATPALTPTRPTTPQVEPCNPKTYDYGETVLGKYNGTITVDPTAIRLRNAPEIDLTDDYNNDLQWGKQEPGYTFNNKPVFVTVTSVDGTPVEYTGSITEPMTFKNPEIVCGANEAGKNGKSSYYWERITFTDNALRDPWWGYVSLEPDAGTTLTTANGQTETFVRKKDLVPQTSPQYKTMKTTIVFGR